MKNLEKQIQLAIDLYKEKKLYKAESIVRDLIIDNSKEVYLYNLIGLVLADQRKIDQAIDFYLKGIKINSNFPQLHNNLGTAYKIKGQYENAEHSYKKAMKIDGRIPEPHNNLGNLYLATNKYKESINSFKKAIELNSKYFIFHYNIAIAYKNIGDFENSKKYLNNSIKLNPNFYTAHRTLSQIVNYKKKNNEHLSLILKIYNDKKIENYKKSELAFALGKIYDDIKDYNLAYKYYNEGNFYRRKEISFSIENEKKEFASLKEIFSKNFISKFNKQKNNNAVPIFILGMPRSGTTLVEQIISSHPKVYGGDELYILTSYMNKNFTKISEIVNLNDKIINKISHDYIQYLKRISSNSPKVTDKFPINFKWIGMIQLMFPKSKIVHCTRNSKDTCLSIFKNYFVNKKLNFAYDLDELVEYYNQYFNLMKYWKTIFPNTIIDINYENLILNPEIEIKKLIKSCDLKWDKKCLNFHKNQRAIKTASDTQARKKIYKTSAGSWKKYEKFLKKSFDNLII